MALKFYQTYKIYIFSATVTLSSLILIVFVIYPQVSKLLTGQKTEIEILEKIKVLEAKAQVLEIYAGEDLNTKVSYTLVSFPVDKDFTTGISLLQDLSKQAGFNIISMDVGTASVKGVSSQSYNIRLDLLGPRNLLPILLSSIENSTRLMRINSLEVGAGSGQLASVSLNVGILYSSAPGDFGTLETPLPTLSADDEEILTKIARASSTVPLLPVSPLLSSDLPPQESVNLPPRGKSNPFE